jgi:hypothetical protein
MTALKRRRILHAPGQVVWLLWSVGLCLTHQPEDKSDGNINLKPEMFSSINAQFHVMYPNVTSMQRFFII